MDVRVDNLVGDLDDSSSNLSFTEVSNSEPPFEFQLKMMKIHLEHFLLAGL